MGMPSQGQQLGEMSQRIVLQDEFQRSLPFVVGVFRD